tara:strand:- start:6394 stop:8199 length:1806 start_codon:yes stop_codon:yes gene_type:complete
MIPILQERWVKVSITLIVLALITLTAVQYFTDNSIDFCGDNICSSTETCSVCPTDCGCDSGNICLKDKCVLGYESITNFRSCFNDFTNVFNSKSYQEALSLIKVCRSHALDEINNIQLLSQTAKDEAKEVLTIEELKYRSDDSYLNYKSNTIKNLYNKYTNTPEEQINNLQLIEDLKDPSLLFSLEQSLFYYYVIKRNYPEHYPGQVEDLYKSTVTEYETNSIFLNQIYNNLKDYNYKFFIQIDPSNPIIREVVNFVTKDSNEEKNKEQLIKFVRENIKYDEDTEWQSKWVSPPALTLMREKGISSDISILLSSLFLNAGIKDVNLCFADTKGYGINHLVVGIKQDNEKFEIWDASCIDCKGSAPETSNSWNLECFDIEQYLTEPLQTCYDQTPYNTCSTITGYLCSDDGELNFNCEQCGCPQATVCHGNQCITTDDFCTENWECSEWSSCSNDQKTRTCNDKNICNTTFIKPIESSTCQPLQIAQTLLGDKSFKVEFSNKVVANFDNLGNLFLSQDCNVKSICNPPEDSFQIQNTQGDVVAYIDSNGDLCLENGKCEDKKQSCDSTNLAFAIKNSNNEIQSYIDNNGELCLKGTLFERNQ